MPEAEKVLTEKQYEDQMSFVLKHWNLFISSTENWCYGRKWISWNNVFKQIQ